MLITPSWIDEIDWSGPFICQVLSSAITRTMYCNLQTISLLTSLLRCWCGELMFVTQDGYLYRMPMQRTMMNRLLCLTSLLHYPTGPHYPLENPLSLMKSWRAWALHLQRNSWKYTLHCIQLKVTTRLVLPWIGPPIWAWRSSTLNRQHPVSSSCSSSVNKQ